MNVFVSVSCPDRIGLVAAIAGRLFDLGGNLGDTAFAVLGGGAEFSSVVELPDETEPADVESELRGLPELDDALISVRPWELAPLHGASGQETHRITLSGGDRPGLVARLCEVFQQFRANIVRLDAERIPRPTGVQYVVSMAVWIPPDSAQACLSTVANTAGGLGLDFHSEPA